LFNYYVVFFFFVADLVKTPVSDRVYPPVHETCSINTNMDCDYTWKHNTSSWAILSKDLIINNSDNVRGIYRCSGHCRFRGRECYIKNIHEVDVRRMGKTCPEYVTENVNISDTDDVNVTKQWEPSKG